MRQEGTHRVSRVHDAQPIPLIVSPILSSPFVYVYQRASSLLVL
jgi:hypothetical protein